MDSDDDIPLFSPEFAARQAAKEAKLRAEAQRGVRKTSTLDRKMEQALAGSGSLQLIRIAPERNMDAKLDKLIQRVARNTDITSLELQVPLIFAITFKFIMGPILI